MWKAIIIHKIKERVWRCGGITILPRHYDSHSAALRASKAARGRADEFFKDMAATYNEDSLTSIYFK